MYRPPGIVEKIDTNIGARTQLDEKIWMTMPTAKLYRRGKAEERKDERDKYDRFGGITGGTDFKRDRDGKDQNSAFKKYEELLYIHTRQENPN